MPALRIDRLASLYLFGPLHKRGRRPHLPILMYHSISDEDQSATRPYYRTTTRPQVFLQQMIYLREAGYSVISLDSALSWLNSDHGRYPRAVVLTFDDGFRDFYIHAFPVLSRYSFPATVFLPTAFIGQTHRLLRGHQCLSWSEIGELHRAGIGFGSHTISHPQLWHLSWRDIEAELQVSKLTIEDRIGAPVQSFSYPYAFPEQDHHFTGALSALLQRSGFLQGVSTILGTADLAADPLFLPRLPVNSDDDLAFFQAKLGGSYDWLHWPQYWRKLSKRRPVSDPTMLKNATY